MEENKGCGCGCGCEEEMEAELLVFENEDGKEETFEVIGVFEVEEKEYIALQSQEDGEFEVEEIEDDEEFEKVSDAFDALVEEDDE